MLAGRGELALVKGRIPSHAQMAMAVADMRLKRALFGWVLEKLNAIPIRVQHHNNVSHSVRMKTLRLQSFLRLFRILDAEIQFEGIGG